MKRTTYQVPELRDENDNIIQQGAFGKNTALANSTNDGWIDYVANDLEALRDNINGSRIYVKNKDALTTPGDISAMYIAEDTGKWYLWDGSKYIETDNARKIADEAIAARDAAKASANDAANSAREQQADWNVTDTTSKAFVKNKPINLVNIGNNQTFNLIDFYKENNAGYPVYFLMHELVQYNPDKPTLPIREVYGFNGMVFGEVRIGNGGNQFLAMVKVGLGYEPYDIYSSSTHYSPVVLKDETNNKYYWAMRINGSYQRVYMFGTFSAPPLMTAILSVDIDGNLPEGWSLVHTAKQYPFNNTIVSNANMDKLGNQIDTTYLKKSDATASLTTNTLTATDATFTGQTSVPTANAGNSSKAIANTEYVQGELTNYLPLSGGTVSGNLTVEGTITGNLDGNADTATNATNDANGNPIAGTYLPLAGGTMTGSIQYVENGKVFSIGNTDPGNVDVGWNWDNREGAGLALRSVDYLKTPGEFFLYARDSANSCYLEGKPDGSLTWGNKDVERVNASGSNYIRYESGLQLCWGIVDSGKSLTVTVTYPVAFNAEPSIATSSTSNITIGVIASGRLNTGFVATLSESSYMRYIAIGKWK